MALRVRRVEYAYVSVRDRPGAAYQLLGALQDEGVDLLAFGAFPTGPGQSQLQIFPADFERLVAAASRTGMILTEPHVAFLVQGDDQLGALVDIHRRLYDANVNVYASNGVTDGKGGYGYVLYVRPEDCDRAAAAFGI
jgi:hypothetical protein